MVIWKYELIENECEIEVPKNCRKIPLKMNFKDGKIFLWLMVDPESEVETRYFRIIGTGQKIPKHSEYVDTFFDDPYVWHLFEVYP